jgi:acetyl-CoA C-acetyltransferase
MAATRLLDPRTPILVGGGQVNERDGGREPVDLIAEAARRAADEAGGRRVLARIESIRVVGMLSWRYRNAAALVGERLGAPVRHTGYTGAGGSNPQALVNAAAEDIAAGRHDAVLVGGAEAWRSRMRLRAEGQRPDWTRQDESVPPPELLIPDVPMLLENQQRTGLDRPAYVYPLFEQALRIAAGRPVDDHRSMIGDLWARFSDVAAGNPHAWTQRSYSAAEIITPSPANRWVSWPYTKLLNSNNSVEQGAAVLLCSVEMAERTGVPRDNWVFLHAGTEAHDSYDIGARGNLHRSPAIREAGAELLRLGGMGIDDIEHVDLYSCFPSAVQVAAMELGLDVQDHARPLTVTGGLTFAGGPWNNYSTHAIATMATLLRRDPGSAGLVTANGGYLTKHAMGLYSTRPPAEAFRRVDVQHRTDAHPTRRSLVQYQGTASVEAWTVVFDRAGAPERGLASVLTADGARAFAATTDVGSISVMLTEDVHNAKVSVSRDGSFAFCELALLILVFLGAVHQ